MHVNGPYQVAFKHITSLSLRRAPRRTSEYACVGSSLPSRSALESDLVSIITFKAYSSVLAFFALLTIILALAGVSNAYDRIISLSPQITESLYLLGAEKQLLAVTTYCKRPREATLKEKIGSPLRPDVEKLVSLRPDLVLGSKEGNEPWVMERLRRLDLRVVYFDRPDGLEGLLRNFLQLSDLVGASDRGREIVAKVREALSQEARGVSYKVLWEVDAEPLMAASTASFVNDIIRIAGGTNIIDSELPYPRINREEVILKAPDLIVLMDHGYAIGAEMKRWQKYLSHTKLIVMDSYITGSPNPVTFLKAVQNLEAAREK